MQKLFSAMALLAAVILGVLAGLGGCGNLGEVCPQNPCASGEICDQGVCREPYGCAGGCPGGERCVNGACIPDDFQCDAMGETCNPRGPVSPGFLCVPWSGPTGQGICSPVCSNGESCGQKAACILVQSPTDTTCRTDSQCPDDKSCQSGRCRYAACRQSECEGLYEGDETCQKKYEGNSRFPDGAKCHPIQNGANFCLPAGTRKRGESCQNVSQASSNNSFEQTCQTGLTCRDGTCQTICEGDGDCSGDDECIGVESAGTVQAGLGQCAATCEPFTEEACSSGETCRPIGDGAGRCVAAGTTEAFAPCKPGAGQCEKGTVCITHQSADTSAGTETIARCHPMCDLSAGERGNDGSLSEEAQARRTATCPQPDPAPAALRFVHAAGGGGAVDIYRSGESQPIVTGLAPGDVAGGSDGAFMTLPAGRYDFSVLPAGAPPTDLPKVEWTATLGAGQASIVALGAPTDNAGDELTRATLSAGSEEEIAEGRVGLRAAHLLPEAGSVDLAVVTAGDSPGGGSTVASATGLAAGSATDLLEVDAGSYDIHLFPAGADRSDADNALLSLDDLSVQSTSTLFVGGTLDPADSFSTLPATLHAAPAAPTHETDKPRLTCVEKEGESLGYCQQICEGGAADYGSGVCEGEAMGCSPTQRQDIQKIQHLCAPMGDGAVGDACNPFASAGECKEGNYCLEYGNTRPGYQQSGARGLCRSYCTTGGGEGGEVFGCKSGRSCKPLSYSESFSVGECNVACEPGDNFTDMSCPQGLRSCTPVASLQLDSSGQGDNPPVVQREQAFCSASGNIEPGQFCTGADCRPAAECMYPRSQQSGLVETLLSSYFASAGGAPRCRPRCDPFDGDDAPTTCGSGETCLFNYPWSAEVGHCAAIASNKDPGESCEQPGLSCGEDSICADRDGGAVCMRFCEYKGADGRGEYLQSTCPSGFKCEPFSRDIGLCRR